MNAETNSSSSGSDPQDLPRMIIATLGVFAFRDPVLSFDARITGSLLDEPPLIIDRVWFIGGPVHPWGPARPVPESESKLAGLELYASADGSTWRRLVPCEYTTHNESGIAATMRRCEAYPTRSLLEADYIVDPESGEQRTPTADPVLYEQTTRITHEYEIVPDLPAHFLRVRMSRDLDSEPRAVHIGLIGFEHTSAETEPL